MSRLFVLNPTSQNRQVWYRMDYSLDGNGNRIDGKTIPPKYLEIPPGAQIPFGGDWHPTQVQDIIQQLEESAGAVAVENIRTAKAKGIVKLVWSLDKAIPRAICEDVKAHNMGSLTDMGVERRKQLAISSEFGLREIAEETGQGNTGMFEMEFESVGEEDPDMTAPKLAEGLRINANAPRPTSPRKGRKAA